MSHEGPDLVVPADWSDVTPEWMTAALGRDFPGAVVSAVDVVKRDDGTNRRARLALTYSEGSGPPVVFVKGEGAYRQSHADNGNMWNEPELFSSGLPLPVEHARPYFVAIDRAALDYVIVMEDVVERGADPRDATRPLTVDQAEDGVRQLAALHSTYWNLHEYPAWLQTWAVTPGWRRSLEPGLPIGLGRARDLLPDALAGTDLLQLCMGSIASFGSGVPVLLHADPHVGNTYVTPDDRMGFLDWQVCRRGCWAMDMAYFLVSALTVEDRRNGEERLLRAYRDALETPSDDKPTVDEVRRRYAAAHPYGMVVWIVTHQSDRSQRPEVCRALIERFTAAVVDSDSQSALADLGLSG